MTKTIEELQQEKDEFISNFPLTKTFTTKKNQVVTRKLYSFEADYPSSEIKKTIFSHGKSGYTLWFLNAKKTLCVVDGATVKGNKVYVTISIDAKGKQKQTYMTLDRFLSLIDKGDFTITLAKFNETYLKPIVESKYYKNKLAEFDLKIAEAKKIQV